MSATAARTLFWGGSVVWVALCGVFVARLVWLDSRLRAHVVPHHVHHWRRLPLTERLTWSCWFVFGSKEDYGDPMVAARRREIRPSSLVKESRPSAARPSRSVRI